MGCLGYEQFIISKIHHFLNLKPTRIKQSIAVHVPKLFFKVGQCNYKLLDFLGIIVGLFLT